MPKQQLNAALEAMKNWLKEEHELGKEPYKIECVKEFDLHDMHYYIFKFKEKMFAEYKLAVCGGYEDDSLEHCGHIFSDYKKYEDKTAIEDAIEIVERIRAYWMRKAKEQEDFQQKFNANTKFRTQEEIPASKIKSQFVKSESRYYLSIGQIDCPTGHICVADPLAYLPSIHYSPILKESIPSGTYNVEVAICRSAEIGIRMSSAKVKVKNTEALIYKRASATSESVIKLKEGKTLEGFPVDAGVFCFCDSQVANEYRSFIDAWYKKYPDANHYDDYFAKYFAKSYQNLPAYQREGGDFMEWENPISKNRMVMIASGFGDGFYNVYYGYDKDNSICEILVPLIDPDLFDC